MPKRKLTDFMYFYYSIYDGTDDKSKVKEEFVSAVNSMVQELKERKFIS